MLRPVLAVDAHGVRQSQRSHQPLNDRSPLKTTKSSLATGYIVQPRKLRPIAAESRTHRPRSSALQRSGSNPSSLSNPLAGARCCPEDHTEEPFWLSPPTQGPTTSVMWPASSRNFLHRPASYHRGSQAEARQTTRHDLNYVYLTPPLGQSQFPSPDPLRDMGPLLQAPDSGLQTSLQEAISTRTPLHNRYGIPAAQPLLQPRYPRIPTPAPAPAPLPSRISIPAPPPRATTTSSASTSPTPSNPPSSSPTLTPNSSSPAPSSLLLELASEMPTPLFLHRLRILHAHESPQERQASQSRVREWRALSPQTRMEITGASTDPVDCYGAVRVVGDWRWECRVQQRGEGGEGDCNEKVPGVRGREEFGFRAYEDWFAEGVGPAGVDEAGWAGVCWGGRRRRVDSDVTVEGDGAVGENAEAGGTEVAAPGPDREGDGQGAGGGDADEDAGAGEHGRWAERQSFSKAWR